jgi:hypothetical protein
MDIARATTKDDEARERNMQTRKRTSRMQERLKAAGFTQQDVAALYQAFFEAICEEPRTGRKFTDADLDFLSALKVSPK